jgi:poly(glycerol-phosphate) alpha-glucosyltransferase
MIKSANLTSSISRNAGGLYESVRRLVQSLIQAGVDVEVIGMLDEFTAADIGSWSPARAISCQTLWPEAFGYSPDFMRELIAYKPDLTHTHGLWQYPSVATNNYCRATKSPYVISPHGMLDPWALRNSRWKKSAAYALYEGTHLRGAACLRALCESEAQTMRQIGLKNPICVIPNGIDPPKDGKHPPTQSYGATGRSEIGKPPWAACVEQERKVLLYLGRIHPKKGLANLLHAWKATLNSQPSTKDWVLAIAGWDQGGHELELKRLCDELGLSFSDIRTPNSELRTPNAVLFLGPQFGDEKAACYCHCDAFVLSSFSEGVPMVILEAWAHGRPVLMTPECNLPEGFAAGAALRIETNIESIARGLQNLFTMSAAERAQMGAHGLQLTQTRFSWPVVATELKRVYEWILGGGQSPACLFLR